MTVFCVTETKSVLYAAAPENFKNVKDKSVKEWNSMKDRYMEFRRARREEAEEILRYRIQEGKEDGPENCCDSWCDVTEL